MSQVRPSTVRLLHFEEALHKTGWGLYYKFLVAFASVNCFTNGFVLLCVHFAIPLSACDTLLTQNDITNIFICFVVGKAIGGFFLSSTADNTGKKCMISKSLIIIFGSCFVSAFSHNKYTLFLAAFFLGSGVQGNIVSMKVYLAEILPMRSRGFYIVLPDLLWTLGYLTTSVYCFGTINSNLSGHQGMDMRLTSWRIIFAIGGGLCITLACASALLEMSPRFLLFKRRLITASIILKQFYAINRSKYSENFDVHSNQLVDLISDYHINDQPEPAGIIQQIIIVFKIMAKMLKVLCQRNFLRNFLMFSLIKFPSLFGLSGWSIYLSRLVSNRNRTTSGEDFIHISLVFNKNCTISLDTTQYENFLFLSINIFIAQIILLCIIDKIGRKFPICDVQQRSGAEAMLATLTTLIIRKLYFMLVTLFTVGQVVGMATCCLTSFTVAFTENLTVMAVAASGFIFGLAAVESTVWVLMIESFPTAIRGTALGVAHFYSFITSCFVYHILEINPTSIMSLFGVLAFGTALAAFFVPETKNRPMIE